jgi:DNA-binding CsgD family transcriptional regulator
MKQLTARQLQILQLKAEGATRDDIGALLAISPHTVKTHLERIRIRLRARNTAHAVAIAVRTGLVEVAA